MVKQQAIHHVEGMNRDGKAGTGSDRVRVAETKDGIVTYLVSQPPEALPPVAPRDLERAWHHARDAAIAEHSGPARMFRFHRGGGEVTDLALTDVDARCWAHGVDAAHGIDTISGLSLCLRLLALVDLLARVGWTRAFVALRPDGAEIGAALLRAAANTPLNREARFDESSLQAQLSRGKDLKLAYDEGHKASLPSGASA